MTPLLLLGAMEEAGRGAVKYPPRSQLVLLVEDRPHAVDAWTSTESLQFLGFLICSPEVNFFRFFLTSLDRIGSRGGSDNGPATL
jgi:hypothetical protein